MYTNYIGSFFDRYKHDVCNSEASYKDGKDPDEKPCQVQDLEDLVEGTCKHARLVQCEVVICTGTDNLELKSQILKERITGYLEKPYEFDKLLSIIKDSLSIELTESTSN